MAQRIKITKNCVNQYALWGLPRKTDLSTIGWTWARAFDGIPGAWYTKDRAVALHASTTLNLPIEGDPE